MKIATWNINSIRARADRALGVLERWDLDVLLLQETKCKPEQFPMEAFEQAGYEVVLHGLSQWNGGDAYWFPDYVADLDAISDRALGLGG